VIIILVKCIRIWYGEYDIEEELGSSCLTRTVSISVLKMNEEYTNIIVLLVKTVTAIISNKFIV
jgi:hypothetical protein